MINDLLLCVRGQVGLNKPDRLVEGHVDVEALPHPESEYVRIKNDEGGWTRDRFINLNKVLPSEDIKMVKEWLKGKE